MRTGSANPLMARTVQLGPENYLYSKKVLTTKHLPHSDVLHTVTLAHTQILVDLTRFQTVDGVRFFYRHARIVSKELAVDKVCKRKLVQTKLYLEKIREGMNRVPQPLQLIRISDIQLQIIHVK